MSAIPSARLTKPQRRAALRLAYWNGGLWSVGNGLVGATLISYLALELGARGLAVGVILATPRLIGLLRVFTPRMLAWAGHRQKFCVGMYAASNVVLLALPVLAAPGVLGHRNWSLVALVACWSLYHLLEYCATVALVSWLGDLVWQRARGEFFGRRERWRTLGRIAGMAAAGAFTYHWASLHGRDLRWQGYALAAAAGALVMLVSLWPLLRMPNMGPRTSRAVLRRGGGGASPDEATPRWRSQLRRLARPPFLRLLLFGCLFSLANGLTQSAQGLFPHQVLDLPLFGLLGREAVMRLGQGAISPALGRWIDHFGNRPVMILSQSLVALGLLFYLPASHDQPWWIAGAWVCWIAYAGINIALSSLTIKLSGPEDSSLYLAAWFGLTGVVYGLSAIAGGALFDALAGWQATATLAGKALLTMGRYELFFCAGVVGRLLAAGSLWWLLEPGASSVREFLSGRRRR